MSEGFNEHISSTPENETTQPKEEISLRDINDFQNIQSLNFLENTLTAVLEDGDFEEFLTKSRAFEFLMKNLDTKTNTGEYLINDEILNKFKWIVAFRLREINPGLKRLLTPQDIKISSNPTFLIIEVRGEESQKLWANGKITKYSN